MKIESVAGQARLVYVRRILIGLGFLGVILFSTGVTESVPLLATAILLAFLGVTNFGRQCPLLLVLRRAIQRSKS